MKCVGLESFNQCCSWYFEGECVQFCPGDLIGDNEPGTIYDCGESASLPLWRLSVNSCNNATRLWQLDIGVWNDFIHQSVCTGQCCHSHLRQGQRLRPHRQS